MSFKSTLRNHFVTPTGSHPTRVVSRLPGAVALSLFSFLALGLTACGGEKSGGGSDAEPASSETPTGRFGADHVSWFEGSFEAALAEAKSKDKMLVVDVWSDHCAQCGIMDEELWGTPDGASLVGDAIAVKVPSDAPESYPFRHKYPITGLPAILLLNPDGNEINRVVGYVNRAQFLVEASEMMTGIDPIPDLEKRVEANPEDSATRFTLLEQYLFRARESEARRQMDAILETDPENQQGNADKAIRALAKYYAFFLMDAGGSADIWRTIPERYPNSSAMTAALKATLDYERSAGTETAWIDWICGLSDRYSANGGFNSVVANYAVRNGVTGDCLAEVARRAESLAVAPAQIDSLIRAISGGNRAGAAGSPGK